VYRRLSCDPVRDFPPTPIPTSVTDILVVLTALPAKTFKEYFEISQRS